MKTQEETQKFIQLKKGYSFDKIEEYHQLQEAVASFHELDSLQSSSQKRAETALKLY